MKFLTSGRVRLAVLGVVVLGLTAGGIAYASIPGSNGVIHGCYQKLNGQLRVIDPGTGGTCTVSENPLDWNQFSGYEVVNTGFEETAITSASAIFEESVACPTGKVALSGGVLATVFDAAGNRHPAQLDSTWPLTSDTWEVRLSKSDGANFAVGEGVRGTAYAICAYAR